MKNKERKDKLFVIRKNKLTHISAKKINASSKKRRDDYLKVICWIVVPLIVCALVVLDAFGIYTFNTERLIVLGIGLLILLLPFFSEITVKDISVKRNKTKDGT